MRYLLQFLFIVFLGFAENVQSQDESLGKLNISGTKLQKCGDNPKTGYFRDGFCHTDPSDQGTHVVCAKVTKEFLEFTKTKGNDLTTARSNYNFPGLVPGDNWCLCALRWKEAFINGQAPKINLSATHSKALEFIDMSTLKKFKLK